MDFENKAPKWDAAGAEPSEDLQKNGFMAGYKPPAAYFNYLFNAYTKCVNELQALLKAHGEDTTNPHDVTAEQVGALPIYTDLTQLGFTNADFTETDFFSNIVKVYNALPNYSEARLVGLNTNLTKSALAKLKDDVGKSFVSVYVVLHCKKYSTNNPMVIDLMVDYSAMPTNNMYTCVYNPDSDGTPKITPFVTSFDQNGFMPKTATASDIGALSTSHLASVFDKVDVLERCKTLPRGIYYFRSSCTNKPIENNSGYHVIVSTSSATDAENTNNHAVKLIALGYDFDGVYFNTFNSDNQKWLGWTTKFLPLTGGTLSGNLTIEKSQPIAYLKDIDSGRKIIEYTYGGIVYLRNALDDNNRTSIVLNPETANIEQILRLAISKSGSNDYYNIYGEHNKDTMPFIHDAGGTMKGTLTLQKVENNGSARFHKNHNASSDYGLTLYDESKDGKTAMLRLRGANDTVEFVDNNGYARTILHTGNKPTGSYTGNGSTTSRTINTKGIGNVCIINSTNGVAIVTECGAILKAAGSTSFTGLSSNTVNFKDGVLTTASNSVYVNASTVEYTYTVL